VLLKAELLQRGGSHKLRGTLNWFLARAEAGESIRGVVAATSGNHGQALALAARQVGSACTIVAPEGSNPLKLRAAEAYGATVVQSGVDGLNREVVADDIAARYGYARNRADDPEGIAGLGTIGVEMLDQVPDVDIVLVPVGLGALIGGVALAVKESRPSVRVIGVEPASAADAAASFKSGRLKTLEVAPTTLADGARALSLSERTYGLIRRYVDDIVVVSEDDILEATWLLWTRTKLLVEPTGALTVAALLNGGVPSGRAIAVLSGGNADVVDLAERFTAAHIGGPLPSR
jgi:threonine dehydratase